MQGGGGKSKEMKQNLDFLLGKEDFLSRHGWPLSGRQVGVSE